MSERSDNLFDDGDEGDDSSTDSAAGASGGESGEAKDPKSTDKRISDLQSAKDKETARANKLQKQLDAIAAATKEDGAEDGKPAAPVAGDPTLSAMLDMARMFAFQQYPKLAEYGLTEADLSGNTPSEIAQGAAGLVARYEKIETQVRNKVLADNGMAPEIEAGDTAPKPQDFSSMSSEDFKKVLDAALNKTR